MMLSPRDGSGESTLSVAGLINCRSGYMLTPGDGSVESTLSLAGLKEHAIQIPKTFTVYRFGRRDSGARPLDQGADPEAFRSQRVDLSHRRILQHNVCAKYRRGVRNF